MREVSGKIQQTFFSRKSCRLWDNMEKYCRAVQATVDNMAQAHFTVCTKGDTNIHSEYVILTASPLQQYLQENTWMLFISVINELDEQNFCFTISLFHASTCFEHMCSKHVEAWNKLNVKQTFCASGWLITEINILSCTVSKTSYFSTYLFCKI